MSKNSIELIKNKLGIIGDVIEEELSNWKSLECMPYDTLTNNITDKLNWSEKDYIKNKAIIRWYISEHDEWTSVRGAKGGVQRKAVVDAKKEANDKKIAIKNEVLAKIEKAFSNDEK